MGPKNLEVVDSSPHDVLPSLVRDLERNKRKTKTGSGLGSKDSAPESLEQELREAEEEADDDGLNRKFDKNLAKVEAEEKAREQDDAKEENKQFFTPRLRKVKRKKKIIGSPSPGVTVISDQGSGPGPVDGNLRSKESVVPPWSRGVDGDVESGNLMHPSEILRSRSTSPLPKDARKVSDDIKRNISRARPHKVSSIFGSKIDLTHASPQSKSSDRGAFSSEPGSPIIKDTVAEELRELRSRKVVEKRTSMDEDDIISHFLGGKTGPESGPGSPDRSPKRTSFVPKGSRRVSDSSERENQRLSVNLAPTLQPIKRDPGPATVPEPKIVIDEFGNRIDINARPKKAPGAANLESARSRAMRGRAPSPGSGLRSGGHGFMADGSTRWAHLADDEERLIDQKDRTGMADWALGNVWNSPA